jgi:hypothetical protein
VNTLPHPLMQLNVVLGIQFFTEVNGNIKHARNYHILL